MSTKQLTKTTHGTRLLKAANKGQAGTVTVAFAQLNVIDHDQDVTLPGAFTPGAKVKVCQTGHAHGKIVAGAGEIVGEKEIDGALWAVAELTFFDTVAGQEEYKTIKALDELGHSQEFSYGYDILDAERGTFQGKHVQFLKDLGPYEISPVLRGAGIGTRQLAVKGMKDWSTNAVWQAWSSLHPWKEGEPGSYVVDTRVDPLTAIIEEGDDLRQVPYAVDADGQVTFDEAAAKAVRRVYEVVGDAPTGDDGEKAAADTCEDCGKSADECTGSCKDDADADVKGRAMHLALQFEQIKARHLVPRSR